ncbi:M23 family metallopeptidase [Aurantiacibacter sp. MUD61]|uniref:M23 family metallopeptidase n=1 Tax=Aurantiacibacter sp. MUD61 TaxID=3009083 RepID=UPI0022F0257C|nr:M23 family metallopeptidase [Aurantiacibacter sp. MUD61]
MASVFLEKVQVALVTATVVSAGWIMAGAVLLDREEEAEAQAQIAAQPEADPLPPEEVQSSDPPFFDRADTAVEVPPEQDVTNLIIPVRGVSADELTDSFSDERGGGTRLHEGIDIMAEEGTAVIAAAPGTVERIFQSDAGGNTVYVRSIDRRTIHYYAHLAEYDERLSEGMQVRRGQRLGTVGSSGNADPSAPHLHFEIMRTNPQAEWYEPTTSVNPFPLLTRQR